MSTTDVKAEQWIVTEHRQVVVEVPRPYCREDAMNIALSGDHPSYVVSDRMERRAYPVDVKSGTSS